MANDRSQQAWRRSRRRAGLGLAAAIAVICGCDREEREFRVEPSEATSVQVVPLTTLQPGEPTPYPFQENPYEDNAWAMSEGKKLYEYWNCKGCHAMGGGDIGPPLIDDTWIYGSQPEQIFSTIVQGRPNGMPSFRGRIPDYQVWQLAAYVRSISGLVRKDAAPARSDHMKSKPPENTKDREQPKDSALPKSAEMPQ